MTRMVLAIVGEPHSFEDGTKGWRVKRYAYVDDISEGERVKDDWYVNRLIDRLTGAESAWECGEKPPTSLKRMFDILVDVSNHGKDNASYKVDYRKYDGCPSQAIDDGMEIYRAIRKFGVRPANKQVKRRNDLIEQERVRRMAAEALVKRFVIGKKYYAEAVDQFGHSVRHEILWDGRKAKKVRTYENGDEYVRMSNGDVYSARNAVET